MKKYARGVIRLRVSFLMVFFVGVFFTFLTNEATAETCSATAPDGLCKGITNSAQCSTSILTNCNAFPRCVISAEGGACLNHCYNTGKSGTCGPESVCLCVDKSPCSRCTGSFQDSSICNNTVSCVTILVGHWKLDETSGLTAFDSSGNNLSGMLLNGPAWNPSGGKINGALYFDGSNDYVEIPDHNQLDITNAITISLWLKRQAINTRHALLAKFAPSVNKRGYYLELDSNNTIGFFLGSANGTSYSEAHSAATHTVLADNLWHHLAATWDKSADQKLHLFLDGQEVSYSQQGSKIDSIQINDIAVWLANRQETSRYFNGLLDDVRLYNYALIPAEIRVIYQAGISDTTPPTKPSVSDEGSTTTKTDQLYASWTSSDPESGIAEYQYKITEGSTSGTVVRDWTSTGTTNYVTAGGLSLTNGKTYYFSVKAKNGAGLWSSVGYSDGITVQTQPIISVTLTPNSTTINRGQTLTYRITLTNNTAQSQTFYAAIQFWKGDNTVKYMDNRYGPITFGPNETRTYNLSLAIPLSAPLQEYIVKAIVGTSTTNIYDRDEFRFTVVQ